MNKFVYRVYYKYDTRLHSDPMHFPYNSKQISEALEDFLTGLPHYLPDQYATISHEISIENGTTFVNVTISTTLDENVTDKAVSKFLNELHLFGENV